MTSCRWRRDPKFWVEPGYSQKEGNLLQGAQVPGRPVGGRTFLGVHPPRTKHLGSCRRHMLVHGSACVRN